MNPYQYLHLAFILFWSGSLIAETERDAPLPLIFVTAEIWPWGFNDAERKPEGLASSLAEKLANIAELPLENRVMPYQRVLQSLRMGHADFAILFEHANLDRYAENLGAVLHTGILLIAPKTSNLELELSLLAGKKVGHIRGTQYGVAFGQNANLIPVPVSNTEQGFDMLQRNRLDAMIISEFAYYSTLDTLNIDESEFRARLIDNGQAANLYMSRLPKHAQHRDLMQQALFRIKEDGRLQSLCSELRSEVAYTGATSSFSENPGCARPTQRASQYYP